MRYVRREDAARWCNGNPDHPHQPATVLPTTSSFTDCRWDGDRYLCAHVTICTRCNRLLTIPSILWDRKTWTAHCPRYTPPTGRGRR